ncbi:MAG: HD domain-containing phosphohydrolase [bacterium]|nr:HD domain-containing phosphohydrolase [bacterium]
MRFVPISRVVPGSRLGRTIHGEDGRVLLRRGTELTREYLARLAEEGFLAVSLLENEAATDAHEEVVSEKARVEALTGVRELMARTREPDAGLAQTWTQRRILYNASSMVLNDLMSARRLPTQFGELRSLGTYGITHAVNVCILGLSFGIHLGMPYGKLMDLAMGLLVHDLGKTVLEASAAHLHETTEAPVDLAYRAHARAGADLLAQMGDVVPATARAIVLQHHERWDGTGFPQGLRGESIHEFAQIAALVNTYDNLLHQTSQGGPTPPHQAIEYLMASGGSHFRLALVQEFLKMVVPFPVETVVRLSTCEEGVVTDVDRGLPLRPVVQVLRDPDGRRRVRPYEIDLRRHPDVTILATL